MRIRHLYPSTSSRVTLPSNEAGFLLRNQVGDVLSFHAQRQTRYEGWYVPLESEGVKFIKLLERIEIVDAHNEPLTTVGLTLAEQAAFWELDEGTRLGYKLSTITNGLTVVATQQVRMRLVLDMRGMYQQPLTGRTYLVTQDPEGYLISYTDSLLETPYYLHIRTRAILQREDTWQEVSYPRDATRHSAPDRLYTFTLGILETDALAFGAGSSSNAAFEASRAALLQHPESPNVGVNYSHDTLLNQTATARLSVTQGLRWLENQNGLWAGLPWFHQVWSRDELLTALGLSGEEQREIIERYIGLVTEKGELPTYFGSGTTCADGVGWLCLLVREYGVRRLSEETRTRLLHFLQKAVSQLRESRIASHGLIYSGHNATWMDTIGREGFRLEIQCMYALALELLHVLSKDTTYYRERLAFLGKLRQHLWQGTYLADGLSDPTIRPNLFFAYLLQPELMQPTEWQRNFDTALSALTLPWGGLASIDQKDIRFQPYSTGQDNISYHNGDSWFFVNNLVAVALHRFSPHRYGTTVMNILQSSTDEILWHNFAGLPGEISSAMELSSWGCGLQAFSGGTYLLLLKELESYSVGQEADSSAAFWGATADSTFANRAE